MSENQLINSKQDLFDKIESYYLKNTTLSPKEEEICERWELAFALLCQHRHKKTAISKYLAKFEREGNPISLPQAYRDFSSAEKMFVPMRKYNKEFLRLTIIESAIRTIKECDHRSKKASTNKDWEAIQKIKDKAELRIMKASGLDINDPDIPDFSLLQPHQFVIEAPDHIKKMFENITAKGVVDITTLMGALSNQAQDIDHEIILDNREEESEGSDSL